MLIWVSALHCEAKPVIDYYRLKKAASYHAFDLYQNQDMACVISGMGKTAVAAATGWVAALFHDRSDKTWINLGSAGAASDLVGELFWVDKITDQSDRGFFPVPTFKHDLPSRSCLTLDEPSTEYPDDFLLDMEASAFFATATRFSSAELAHCLKVVSDNQDHPQSRDKATISQLIQNQISSITSFADKLKVLGENLSQYEIDATTWKAITEQAHFSQTQQIQLRNTLRFLQTRMHKDNLVTEVNGLSNSRDILSKLDQLRLEESRNL